MLFLFWRLGRRAFRLWGRLLEGVTRRARGHWRGAVAVFSLLPLSLLTHAPAPLRHSHSPESKQLSLAIKQNNSPALALTRPAPPSRLVRRRKLPRPPQVTKVRCALRGGARGPAAAYCDYTVQIKRLGACGAAARPPSRRKWRAQTPAEKKTETELAPLPKAALRPRLRARAPSQTLIISTLKPIHACAAAQRGALAIAGSRRAGAMLATPLASQLTPLSSPRAPHRPPSPHYRFKQQWATAATPRRPPAALLPR